MRHPLRCLSCLLALPLLLSCGGDSTAPDPTPAPPPTTPPPPPPPPAPVPVGTVVVTPGSLSLVPQQTRQLDAVTRDSSGNALSGRTVTWTSAAPTVASVSAAGLVTGVAPGTTAVIATSEQRSDTAQITVADGGFVLPTGTAFTAGAGRVAIDVPAGAVAVGTAITVAPLATPPAHPRLLPGTAWTISADTMPFAQPVTVRLTWLAEQLPQGTEAELIRVHRHDGSAWVELANGSVDVATRTSRGTATSFSPFALIQLPSNPAPVLSRMNPDSATAGTSALTLTVTGTGFVDQSEVRWNGGARATTFVSDTILTAQITAADIAAAGTAAVTVFSPSPGGGTTAPLTFTIVPPPPPQTTFVVTTTSDAGAGSLRQAIIDANTTPGIDSIHFNIPGAGPHTITPSAALPPITEPVTIDGLTQPGASCATWPATLQIELRGSNVALGSNGLTLAAGHSVVRGLVINRFDRGTAIHIESDENAVECSYLGTDVTGTLRPGGPFGHTHFGVRIDGGDRNVIGGTIPSKRNLISNNDNDGIRLEGGATGNVVAGNFIGTTVTGLASLENDDNGVTIADAPGTIIGGPDHDAGVCNHSCNLISGNDDAGIEILGDGGNNIVIQGNFIGTDLTGTVSVLNDGVGILIDVRIGTIGTSGHLIGGVSDPGVCSKACNLISGNDNEGIRIDDRVHRNITVQGNFIGTNNTGMAAIPNGQDGMTVSGDGHRIGGAAPGEGNLISGNGDRGIDIGADNTVVEGNLIGTRIDGSSALGNGEDGIGLFEARKRIGGTAAGQGNIIAYNGGAGIFHGVNIGVPENARNSFLGNSIFANGGLGIDLGARGVTPNDPGDTDTGPNNLQNFPVLSAATFGSSLSVTGTLNSTASTTFRVEFFANDALDPSGHGEGQRYLGFVSVTTNASGDAAIAAVLPAAGAAVGQFITATATDSAGNTSEFSAGIAVQQPNGVVVPRRPY